MALADRPKLEPVRPGRPPRVDVIMSEMSSEDRKVFNEYLHNTELSADRVALELTAAGWPISGGAIAMYRSRKLGLTKRVR